jgi:hypothetical protein
MHDRCPHNALLSAKHSPVALLAAVDAHLQIAQNTLTLCPLQCLQKKEKPLLHFWIQKSQSRTHLPQEQRGEKADVVGDEQQPALAAQALHAHPHAVQGQ